MQDVKEIHKINIEKIRKKYKHMLSSHAFSSLYLWQYPMKLLLSCEEDFFVLKYGIYGENAWFFPCGNEEKIYDFICKHMLEKSFSLSYMREEDVKWLEEKFPNKWEFHHVEGHDEYIGDIAEFVSLEGSKFAEIRRKLRKIDKKYQVTSAVITEKNLTDAISVVSAWQENRDFLDEQNLTDEDVAIRALEEREFLEISGIILYVDKVPVCVFAGFPLSEDMLDAVIGKSVPNAPNGITYYGLREYLRLCGAGYTYCNYEEDLGILGIRQMKNRLYPIFKVPIWEAVLK